MVIVSYEDLPRLREKHRDKKIVCCTGVFDLTHAGHILFFEDCKKQGDILVVLVGRDSLVKSYKGEERPILNEHIRLKTIDSLKPVDYVILDRREKFKEGEEVEGIKSILPLLKPDIYVINGDVPNIEERKKRLEEFGVKFIVLDRSCPEEFDHISTTKIIKRLQNNKMENLGHTFKNCQVCGSDKLHRFLSLGHHPNPDGFLSKEQLKEPEIYYPLDMFFCENCKLVQLGYAPNPASLFSESFIYTTGSSKELVDNFHALAENLIKRFNLTSEDLVIDIGSNDGTLLENFLLHNIKVLGVDPSKAAELAVEKNIPTLKYFFNTDTANKILNREGKAKIITATNVFAHVKDLDSFMGGVKLLLDDNGVFVQESGYVKTLIDYTQYDSIYVEHLRYYSLKSLINLFDKFGMDVFDAEVIATHGGSIRTYACKKGAFSISENVQRILKEEAEFGLHSSEIFDGFAKKVEENRTELRKILFDLKSQGKRIVCVGAPAKGNTLLNFCKIGNETIDALLERGSLKVGKYSPGMHIPIVEEDILFRNNPPEVVLLLIWNLEKIVVPRLREKGYKGVIVVPVPKPHVL